MPINILILLKIIIKKTQQKTSFAILLYWYNATLFQITSTNSNSIGSACNNIMVIQKSTTSTIRLHCAVCKEIMPPITTPLLLKKQIFFFFIELLLATIYILNFMYCYSYFFSFCAFYPKSLQLVENFQGLQGISSINLSVLSRNADV